LRIELLYHPLGYESVVLWASSCPPSLVLPFHFILISTLHKYIYELVHLLNKSLIKEVCGDIGLQWKKPKTQKQQHLRLLNTSRQHRNKNLKNNRGDKKKEQSPITNNTTKSLPKTPQSPQKTVFRILIR